MAKTLSPEDLLKLPDLTATWTAEDWELVEKQLQYEQSLAEEDPLNHGLPPHEGQEEMHMSSAKRRLVIMGNRAGKSWSACREAVWWATGTHPYRNVPNVDTIWIGCETFSFLREVHVPYILSFIPKALFIEHNKGEHWVSVRRADGGVCKIYFKSYEMGRAKWQGAKVQLLILDEEPPEDIYKEGRARLVESRGDWLIVFTPVSGMGWTYDRLYLPAKKEADAGIPVEDRYIHLIQRGTAQYDPTAPYGVGRSLVPHIPRSELVEFARDIPDPDERAIRIFGEFRGRSGAIYKNWEEACHMVKRFKIPTNWTLWAGCDAGHNNFTVVLCAMDPAGRIYVVDEYISQEEGAKARLLEIWKRALKIRGKDELTKEDRREWLTVHVDPEDPGTILALNEFADEFKLPINFVALDQARKALSSSIMRVRQALEPRNDRTKPKEVEREEEWKGHEPQLYVFNDLRSKWIIRSGSEIDVVDDCRIRWEMRRYTYRKATKANPHPDEPDNNSAHGHHMLDALRYAIVAPVAPPEADVEDKYAGMSPMERAVAKELAELREQMEKPTSNDERSWVME